MANVKFIQLLYILKNKFHKISFLRINLRNVGSNFIRFIAQLATKSKHSQGANCN